MEIRASLEYAASPERVFAMLTDEGFQRRKCERTGALNQSVTVSHEDGGAVVVTKRTLPTERFPDFAKSMLGETILVTETTTWSTADGDGSRTGTMVVDLGAAPVALNAALTLASAHDGQSSLETVEGDLKARIPLVGGKIEKAAKPAVEYAIRMEQDVGQEWLAT